ncbi:universal stress protein [Natronolimnohabitans sp. A-GB9]|uniref:universal stress protein n=1 Tax=Natronolimnohabitans sp. A-GB9 TaxID=3069757 RepID=UPI0027B68345|nr:universal stress protein [Natronolimnohabitans sp. A-GB9]MDQ2051110.1 universal stress protein [Natronolimnohabitans sp. A-GB9]
MVQEILCPTDGSENSYRAIAQATRIAEPADATVHVLAVIPEMTRGARLREEWEERVTESLERGEELVAEADLEFESERRHGPVAQEIVEYADDHDVDMIVMGTHGRTGLHKFLVGSVTQRTIELASIPVVTVPPDEDTG